MTVTVDLRGRNALNAKQLIEERNRSFEESDRWDNETNSYGVDPVRRNYCGIMCEFAFASRYSIPVDMEKYEKTDGYGDFYVEYDGERCHFEVKVAQKEPYALFVKEGCVSADYCAGPSEGGRGIERVESHILRDCRVRGRTRNRSLGDTTRPSQPRCTR